MNVILVARRLDRLEELATELAQNHGVQTIAVSLDLGHPDFLQGLQPYLDEYEIGLVINNAGIAVDGPLIKKDLAHHLQLEAVNVRAPLVIAHAAGLKMTTRGKGAMIFVGSLSAYFAAPFLSTYAASKAWILSLALALSVEWKRKNVVVQALCPGYTESEMTDGMRGKVTLMKTQDVVDESLAKLGRRTVVVTGWQNKLSAFVFSRLISRERGAIMIGKMVSK